MLYTPAIKGKAGELNAVKWLSDEVQAQIRLFVDFPRIDVPEGGTPDVDYAVEKLTARLASSYRVEALPIVDHFDLDLSYRTSDGVHPVIRTFERLRAHERQAIPALGLDRDDEYVQAARDVLEEQPREIALRLLQDDLDVPAITNGSINNLLIELDVDRDDVHLVLDLRSISPLFYGESRALCERALHKLEALDEYNSLSLISSAMPASFAEHVPSGGDGYIERTEYRLWRDLLASESSFMRTPAYGDYGIVHPEYFDIDPRLIANTMGPKSRYTLSDSWYVVRGTSFQSHPDGYGQYHGLAQQLAVHPQFAGADFSEGDRRIVNKANRNEGTGSPGQWISLDMNHHINFVVRQLS